MYRCEKCNLEKDIFNWRLILSVNIVDMTENQWAQCFQEQGEQILGVPAQELGDWFISDKEAYDKVFEVIIKPFCLIVKREAHVWLESSLDGVWFRFQ